MAIHRECGQEIVWLMRSDGSWHPPLEPEASGVSLEGVVVLMENPTTPRIIDTAQLAIYRQHVCARRPSAVPYSPPKRTLSFDELAAQKAQEERAESVRLLGEEETRKQEYNRRYMTRPAYTRTGTLRGGMVIDHSCPECGSPPGMICFSPKLKVPRSSPHNERKWLVVEKAPSPGAVRARKLANGYDADDERRFALQRDGSIANVEWPAALNSDALDDEWGTVNEAMYLWLRDNANLFLDLR